LQSAHERAPAAEPLAGEETVRDRILRAAIEKIARKGPVATTVRDICLACDANVAAVSYYFGAKEHLVKEALLAILEPVNIARLRLLDDAQRQYAPGPAPVPLVLEALLRPLVECERSADGGRLFIRTEQHLRANPDSDYTRYVARRLDHYAQRFIDALARSMPRYTRSEVIWRYEFIRGAAMHLLGNCDPLSDKFHVLAAGHGMIDFDDNDIILKELLAIATAGIASPPAWGDAQLSRT